MFVVVVVIFISLLLIRHLSTAPSNYSKMYQCSASFGASSSHVSRLAKIPHFQRNCVKTSSFAIECQNLGFSVSAKQGKLQSIVKDCTFRIPSGKLWMLLGLNGCGKSTLLKILAGLLKPTNGFARVKKPRSFVFQNPDHQVVMPTVQDDVAFGLSRYNLSNDEIRSRVGKALEAVGMYEYLQRPVQTLSGGQKQRVAIAGALAESSKVLLLDELTTFLDETDQVGVLEAVKRTVSDPEEVTALWVTHRLEELEYADGALYMEDGRIVMQSDPSSMLNFIEASKDSYLEH